jgi:hypothetical protein
MKNNKYPMIFDRISVAPRFAICGAQVVANGAYTAVRALYDRTPECFIVSASEGNPAKIDGLEVRTLDTCGLDAENTFVLIAVTELLQDEVAAALQSKGYSNTFRLTAHEEHMLMSEYYASIGKFPALDSVSGGPPADLALYEVRNHRDKPLSNRPRLQYFERSIQAGAAVTGERIAPILDNAGDNISAKNKQYCEMSAAYWIWKNTKHAWKGMEHYRRRLLVTPEMLNGGADAVMPLPYICYPNTLAQFRRLVSEDVLNALLRALKILHPGEYDAYLRILNGQYQYSYNLVCAKREVFDAYCSWLFGITEYMETLANKTPEIANTRALSYVTEVLTNLYFMSNQDKLTIRHAEKAIYT